MREEDLTVQQELIEAGFGDHPAACRGDLHWTLTTLMQNDPDKNGDLVDRLRVILSAADALDTAVELAKLKALHKVIKGCPDCGGRPDFFSGLLPGTGEGQVVCLHAADATIRSGETLAEAIASWNSDDWTLSVVRAVYEITG